MFRKFSNPERRGHAELAHPVLAKIDEKQWKGGGSVFEIKINGNIIWEKKFYFVNQISKVGPYLPARLEIQMRFLPKFVNYLSAGVCGLLLKITCLRVSVACYFLLAVDQTGCSNSFKIWKQSCIKVKTKRKKMNSYFQWLKV